MIKLRKASTKDCRLIWKWSNDQEVRTESFASDPIPYQDHCKWFESKITSPAASRFQDCMAFLLIEISLVENRNVWLRPRPDASVFDRSRSGLGESISLAGASRCSSVTPQRKSRERVPDRESLQVDNHVEKPMLQFMRAVAAPGRQG